MVGVSNRIDVGVGVDVRFRLRKEIILLPSILTANLQPITALSESGDAVAKHSVGNLPNGVTVTGWSLETGGAVFNLTDNGATADVTVDSSAGVDYLLGDISYVVRATLSEGDSITLEVDVTVNQIAWDLALDFGHPDVTDHPDLTFNGNTASTAFGDYAGNNTAVAGPSRMAIVGGRELPSSDWDNTDADGFPVPDETNKGALLDGTASGQRFTLLPGDWYESAGGTFFFEVEAGTITTSTLDRVMDAYSANGAAQDQLILYPVSSKRHLYVKSGNAAQASLSSANLVADQREVIGLRLKTDDFLLRSGAVEVKDSDGALPVWSTFRFGIPANSGNRLSIRRMLYTPDHLTDAQIERVVSDGLAVHSLPGLPTKAATFTEVVLKPLDVYRQLFGVQADSGNEIPATFSQEILVTNESEFAAAFSTIAPGGCIRVQDGTYTDWGNVVCNGADGTATNRIYVLPQTLEGVKFTGTMYIRIFPDYIVMRGMDLDGCGGLHHSVRFEGNHCKFVRNRIDAMTSYGIAFYGDDTEIANNNCVDNDGTCFIQPDTNPLTPEFVAVTKRNHYHHNSFVRPGPNPGGNSGSPIALGYGHAISETLDDQAGAIVEWNYFDSRADGEIITVKSDANIIRYNWFEDGQTSHISIRMGADNLVYGNILTVMNVAWRWSGERNRFHYNLATAAASSSVVARLVGQTAADSYRASTENQQTHNLLVGFDFHADLQSAWEESETPRPNGNITQKNLFLNATSLPGFSGQGLYNEAEYLSLNPVSGNALMEIDKGGRYISASAISIDFQQVITVNNPIHGPIVIDPRKVPWLRDISFSA